MGRVPSRGAASVSGLALAAAAAQRFYVENLTKTEIARQLGVSRFKVARLLSDAQEAGLVQIRVLAPPSLDAELADALRTRFGVSAAFVLRAEEDTVVGQRRAVGVFTAGLLQEVLAPEDVVGLAWGRAISVVAASVHAPLRCRFVQLSGALPRPDVEESAVDLVRRVASGTSSTAVTFYAPLAVADAATADSLRAQSGIAEALAEHEHLTKAVVSIGAWTSGESTALDSLEASDAAELEAAGAVAEITGVLLGADGRQVPGLADRVIGITADQLRRTPDVIAMATGDAGARAAAVAAVLRSGLVSAVVTHAELARRVLQVPDPAPR